LNYVDDLNPDKIDAIILTHNHIDHTGLVPKAVKNGYRNPIYMTEITRDLIQGFWNDCAEQQESNAQEMREKFPLESDKFRALYHVKDVDKALKLCVGVPFRKSIEILPGVKLTFWENGHILGAGLILLQCSYPNMKPINILFTGDLKMKNCFFNVPRLPKWFRNMELIMICESTYGSTRQEDIKCCFRDNILEAFAKKQNILIGAFAQGRMQEMLYEFKVMQEDGLIPNDYAIYVDGPLGIETTFKYQRILDWFNPSKRDFMPEGLQFVDPKFRDNILSDGVPKIVITTSGMLSNGPARIYVPMFLEHKNSLIHLVGYAAEETLARTLLDAKRDDVIQIGGHEYKKNAVVKTTREKSSHATQDQLIDFINRFNNVKFIGINHGNTDVKKVFADKVADECDNVDEIGIFDREHMYCFYRVGYKHEPIGQNIIMKTMPAGLINESRVLFGREVETYNKVKTNKGYQILYCKIRYVGKQVLSISEKSEFTFEIENTVENIRYCKTADITDSKR
jgi:metallo-beta-lactamase family protein